METESISSTSIKLVDLLKDYQEKNTLLWDVNSKCFIMFKLDDQNINNSYCNIIPESKLPPVLKSEIIKRLKADIEKDIADKYLGTNTSEYQSPEHREYEIFQKLYTAGMRRTNSPQNDDEKYFNRLYDKHYKRMTRSRKIEPRQEEEVKCPYVFKTNCRIHKKGDVCSSPARSCYGGFCSKHKIECKFVSLSDHGVKTTRTLKVMDHLLNLTNPIS